MMLADANLLLYAYNTDADQHNSAREWLELSLSGPDLFGLTWQTIMAFIRIGPTRGLTLILCRSRRLQGSFPAGLLVHRSHCLCLGNDTGRY